MAEPPRETGPAKRKSKQGPAARLRKATIAAIQALVHSGSRPMVVPVFSGGVEIDGRRYLMGRAGASDLVCCFKGRFFALELKAGRDVVSDAQKKFAMRVAQAGGVYVVVRQPQDAVDALMD